MRFPCDGSDDEPETRGVQPIATKAMPNRRDVMVEAVAALRPAWVTLVPP
jgi:hypothetical protein